MNEKISSVIGKKIIIYSKNTDKNIEKSIIKHGEWISYIETQQKRFLTNYEIKIKYKRIIIRVYNFWFDTDIVPTVASTLSFDGMIEYA